MSQIHLYRMAIALGRGCGVHNFYSFASLSNREIQCRIDFDHLALVRTARTGGLGSSSALSSQGGSPYAS